MGNWGVRSVGVVKTARIDQYVQRIQEVIQDEKYTGELTKSDGIYSYPLLMECTERIGQVIVDGCNDIKEVTRVVDGYLIPYGENEWVRLIDDGYSYRGFVVYQNYSARRIIVDRVMKACNVQDMDVLVVQGEEGVRKRLEV